MITPQEGCDHPSDPSAPLTPIQARAPGYRIAWPTSDSEAPTKTQSVLSLGLGTVWENSTGHRTQNQGPRTCATVPTSAEDRGPRAEEPGRGGRHRATVPKTKTPRDRRPRPAVQSEVSRESRHPRGRDVNKRKRKRAEREKARERKTRKSDSERLVEAALSGRPGELDRVLRDIGAKGGPR